MNAGQRLLAAWIDRSKLKQKHLAVLLGISDGYLSQLLSGERTPGLEQAKVIETHTGVPMGSWLDTQRGKSDATEKVGAK